MVQVLDHGYVRLDGIFGSDQDIVRIARVSTGKGNKSEEEDRKFIDYLWRNHHDSPFEFPVLCFELKMPIFVARQWVRHRTHSMSEFSGRYSEMPEEMYLPDVEHMRQQGTDNRQGSGEPMDPVIAEGFRQSMVGVQRSAKIDYHRYLSWGMSKELARINLPLAQYTRFFWQQNLRNLLHLLSLRLDAHAQPEAQAYAQAVYGFVKEHFPWTYDAFERWTLNSVTFGEHEVERLRELIASLPTEVMDWFDTKSLKSMSHRHYKEFMKKIGVES